MTHQEAVLNWGQEILRRQEAERRVRELEVACAAMRDALEHAQQDCHERGGGSNSWRDCKIERHLNCKTAQQAMGPDAGKGYIPGAAIAGLLADLKAEFAAAVLEY